MFETADNCYAPYCCALAVSLSSNEIVIYTSVQCRFLHVLSLPVTIIFTVGRVRYDSGANKV